MSSALFLHVQYQQNVNQFQSVAPASNYAEVWLHSVLSQKESFHSWKFVVDADEKLDPDYLKNHKLRCEMLPDFPFDV